MGIYTFPDGFITKIKTQRLSIAGDVSIAGGGSFGSASSNTVGFGGNEVLAQGYQAVSCGAGAPTELGTLVDVLQAWGIMGDS